LALAGAAGFEGGAGLDAAAFGGGSGAGGGAGGLIDSGLTTNGFGPLFPLPSPGFFGPEPGGGSGV
jgi:hypothetical protein